MIDVASIVLSKLQGYTLFAKQFARSRYLVAASQFGMNEEQKAQLEKVADSITWNVKQEGSSISISFEQEDSYYANVIKNGVLQPRTGGQGGFVHHPDGSVTESNVPINLQGNLIEGFIKQGVDVMGQINTMMKTLFKDAVKNAVESSRQQIAQAYKSEILQNLNFTGGK